MSIGEESSASSLRIEWYSHLPLMFRWSKLVQFSVWPFDFPDFVGRALEAFTDLLALESLWKRTQESIHGKIARGLEISRWWEGVRDSRECELVVALHAPWYRQANPVTSMLDRSFYFELTFATSMVSKGRLEQCFTKTDEHPLGCHEGHHFVRPIARYWRESRRQNQACVSFLCSECVDWGDPLLNCLLVYGPEDWKPRDKRLRLSRLLAQKGGIIPSPLEIQSLTTTLRFFFGVSGTRCTRPCWRMQTHAGL
jgi:hypothetical protein